MRTEEDQMDYTPEQRAIIARIGDISARYHAIVEEHRRAQIAAGGAMLDAISALTAAIDRSNELAPLFLAHGDAFREFLDTL
jgi:hypothetical protein